MCVYKPRSGGGVAPGLWKEKDQGVSGWTLMVLRKRKRDGGAAARRGYVCNSATLRLCGLRDDAGSQIDSQQQLDSAWYYSRWA